MNALLIHIGGDRMIRLNSIIGIFDIHICDSEEWRSFFEHIDSTERLEVIDTPATSMKSVIITDNCIYLSPISSMTLKKRAAWLVDETEDTDKPDFQIWVKDRSV